MASWGSGGHLRGVLVPPCDPEAQTTFSPPPRARSMVFYDGARAPWGLRRSPISARGECQQGADPSSPPLPESGLRAWQVLGGLRMRFLVCAGCAKGARGRPKKRRLVDACGSQGAARSPQAAVLQRGQPQYSRLQCFLCFSDGPWRASAGRSQQNIGLFAWLWGFLCAYNAKMLAVKGVFTAHRKLSA